MTQAAHKTTFPVARIAWCHTLLVLWPLAASAQRADEIALVVNRSSAGSARVAEHYVRLRGVPEEHVVEVKIPHKFFEGKAEIPPEAFERYIWNPVSKTLERRGLREKVLAWVYSVDFPIRVTTDPPVSLMGATFTGNRFPGAADVSRGLYRSALYAGPDRGQSGGGPTASFREMKEALGGRMPVPSMMLGYTGDGGNDVETVLQCLEQGAASDGSAPRAKFFFCRTKDVRSTCRDWQFEAVRQDLEAMGQEAVVLDHWPTNATRTMGLMIGRAAVPGIEGNGYLPGAMGEHLTSAAAMFHIPGQDRLTKWIAAGCTASAGAVVEPFALWMKFPHARFYVHYVGGATMMESFYLALRCPMQLLLVGDPLAGPWVKADPESEQEETTVREHAAAD